MKQINEFKARNVVDGIKIIDTKHAIDRFVQRNPISAEEMDEMMERIALWLKKKGGGRPTEEYMFFSKKYNQAIVIAYRKEHERYATDNKRHVIVMTVLPRGKNTPKPGTPKITVEAHKNHLFSDDEIQITEFIVPNENILNESLEDGDYSYQDIVEQLGVVFVEGKAYNLSGNIEVVDLDSGIMEWSDYAQYQKIDEEALTDLVKSTIPKKVLHWLKRVLHKKHYKAALELYNKLMQDTKRQLTPQRAMVIAAKTVNISPRELEKVWPSIQ